MPYRLPPLNALRAFEAAARHLSFKHAAQELSVTPTAISHQIKMLEDFLGMPLFRRLTRALELTTEGEVLLPKVREGLLCFSTGLESLRQRLANEKLVVVVPPSFATRWLVPRLRRFAELYPAIELHVRSRTNAIDDEQVEGTRAFDGLEEEDDCARVAICFGHGNYPGLDTHHIFASGYVAVCSPRLLEGQHPLVRPEDVRFHPLIHDDTIGNDRARPSWESWLKEAGVSGVDAASGPHFHDSGLALVAAADGLGIALASRPLVALEVAAGKLVVPFKVTIGSHFSYHLVIPETLRERSAVKAFREWLLNEARAMEQLCRDSC